MGRLSAAVIATALLASGITVSAAPVAFAAVDNTRSCVDGGGVTWNSKVTWGRNYRDAAGVLRVQVDYAGWTTAAAGNVHTDSVVSTYDGAGRLLQTLPKTAAFDFSSGARFDARNPQNPPSAAGRSRITVSTGVDGDGYGVCTATFVQPNLNAVPSGSVSKVATIVVENHSLEQMKAGMPYLFSLAQRYAYSDNFSATRHPSLPNYLAIAGGDTFGVSTNGEPAAQPLNSKTVFGQALDNGRTAGTYAESMPANCTLTGNVSKGYAVKHNPWAYFTNERAACQRYDVPETGFRAAAGANALPSVSMVIPNQCHNAHDCDLGIADAWLQSRLQSVLTSTDFTSGALAVVVTADEDDSRGDNKVLTVVLHRSLDGAHAVVTTPLNHYSLSRMYSQTVGAAPLLRAASVPDMAAAFGLPVGPAPADPSVRVAVPGWRSPSSR